MDISTWLPIFEAKAQEVYSADDPSHDMLHIHRVIKTAIELAQEEAGDLAVIIPAAYFHDFVNVPKNDPRRTEASRMSAVAALEYLSSIDYPADKLEAIGHAIEAHSFSANITPRTLEAKIVQDADRLDGLGAIGIARCFTVGGILHRPIYHAPDLMAEQRELDDFANSVDHFFVKLFKLPAQLQTPAARTEATRRVNFMRAYLEQLKSEVE